MLALPDEALASKYVIKTHYVVHVLKFYPESQTVDVIQDTFEFSNTPLGDMTIKNEFGQTVTVGLLEPSIIYGVPVQQLRWGQFTIQAAPKPGDTGYIEVFTNDITSWKREGGIAIPWSDRHFVKESCVFVPFIANDTNATEDYVSDENTLVIKSNNATVKITDKEEEGQDPVVDIETTSKTVHINAEDGVSVDGNVDITGDLTVSGTITADGDIKSTNGDVVAGTVSLKNHTHMFTYSAGPSAGAQGTTNTPTP